MAALSVVALAIIIVVVLVIAVRTTIAITRSVLEPLYRLRAWVLALAIGQPSAPAPDVTSLDEIDEIARAIEQMRSRMSRLGGDEAGLHKLLDTMFMNLSHRSQTLVERQMRLIENLERGEQDKDRRATLFRMNSIAARMHRDSQNLLILAGHELSSGWDQPMALMNVIRAAMSEVEEYERISVRPQPEIAVSGPAVNDVVHLLAELIQNATSFSAADMPVEISGQLLNSGGALVAISDRGVGMDSQEMAYANWRLENPSPREVEIPKWIGLMVVSRLAARRGVRVRLQHAEFGGLTALVWLPDELISRQNSTVPPGFTGSAVGPMRGAHQMAVHLNEATVQQSTHEAPSADFVPPQEEVPSAPLGRRLTFAERRQPGQARTSVAAPPMATAEPAAAEVAEADGIGPLGKPGGQAAPGYGSVTGQDPLAVGTAAALPGDTSPLRPETGSADGVTVPPGNPPEDRRLPIYESVESHWFSGGRHAPGSARTTDAAWASPADKGWQAAEAVESPSVGASTPAGLPRRLPNANLVPGAIPSTQAVAAPNRSAAEVRDRLARFQRGTTEGRAAASEAAKPAGDNES